MRIVIGQKAENVPTGADMAVYSDAVPEDNLERARARELGIPQLSYFEMLGGVSKGKKTVAVAGTHGKTTTTGILAKILSDGASGDGRGWLYRQDFGSNYLHGDSDIFVVEACEYRNHLLELSPHVLVIMNLEWGPHRLFPLRLKLQDTFRKAIDKVPAEGIIVTDPNNRNIAPLLRQGYAGQAHIIDYTKEPAYELRLPGEFNQNNARAAAAAARAVFPALLIQ